MQDWAQSDEATSIPLLVTRPEGAPRAGLVLIHEAFGVTEHIEDVCRRFAEEGYLVVAPALFHRLEEPVFPYDQVTKAKDAMAKLDPSQLIDDVRIAIEWSLMDMTMRGRSVGVIGFCFGGRVSFTAATQLPVIASTVSFYGGGIGALDAHAPICRTTDITSPVLAVYGEKDPLIPSDEVARVRAALALSGVPNVVRTYRDAGHGFFCDARPDNFDKDAADDAWALTLMFLTRTLRG